MTISPDASIHADLRTFDMEGLYAALQIVGAFKLSIRRAAKWRKGDMERDAYLRLKPYGDRIDEINREVERRVLGDKTERRDRWQARTGRV